MTVLPITAGDIAINGLTLNTVDASGTAWWLTNLDGWWGLPDLETPDEDLPAPFDGSFDLEGRYKARVMTLSGGFRPSSPSVAITARQQLMTACQLVHQTGLLVMREITPKQAQVRLSGRPNIATVDPTGTTVFEIGLKAPDPRKYAVDAQVRTLTLPDAGLSPGIAPPLTPPIAIPSTYVTGLATVSNLGDYPAGVIFKIYGPVTSPEIIDTASGETLSFDLTIAAGDYLLINTGDQTALYNGIITSNYGLGPGSTWFKVGPGTATFTFTAGSAGSAAYVVITFRSAWIS